MKLLPLKAIGLCLVLLSQSFGQVAIASGSVHDVKGEVASAISKVSGATGKVNGATGKVSGGLAKSDIDVALNLLSKGLEHCTKATRSTRTNQLAAMKEFNIYVTALNRAKAIYPKISEHSRVLSRQVKQCSQIGTDIARMQALPLLEKGVLACKEAKTLAKGDYLSKARVKYKEYLDFRNQAVALTDSVLKVASNSSKVRRCDKLESSLMAAQTRVVNDEQKADELISLLQRAEDSCLVAQRMATKSGESRVNLDTTKSMLGHAERYFNETQLHQDALKRAANYPGYSSSKQVLQLTSTFSVCRDELVAIIDAATKSVIRQEELSKLREQQQIQKAVALAVAEAKKEAVAAFKKQALESAQVVAEVSEPVSASVVVKEGVVNEVGGEIAASEVTVPSSPRLEKKKMEKLEDKNSVARARAGKSSRARTDVVQVTESW